MSLRRDMTSEEKLTLTCARLSFEEYGYLPHTARQALILIGLDPWQVERKWTETAYR